LGRRAIVPNGGEFVGWGVEGKPLLDCELPLAAWDVSTGGCDLHIVAVPPMMWACTICAQPHGADWPRETWASAAKTVQITPLEVAVIWAH